MNADSPGEYTSLKEEVFWFVATIPNVAANPALMVTSLMEFLSECIALSIIIMGLFL